MTEAKKPNEAKNVAAAAAAKVRFLKSSSGMIGSAARASMTMKSPRIARPAEISPATSGVPKSFPCTFVSPISTGMIPAAKTIAPRKSILWFGRPLIVGSSIRMIAMLSRPIGRLT
jgi:hypothetical protein